MATTSALFLSLQRRRLPSLEAFLVPVDLTDAALVQTLVSLSANLISSFSGKLLPFQRKNYRSLIRKIEVFLVIFEYLRDCYSSSTILPWKATLCYKELYLLLYRSKLLLDYCTQSSKLWLLLQNHSISGHFHDLDREISTLLDVFPVQDVESNEDLREQIELMKKQSKRDKLFIDKHDEDLRSRFFSFLDEFENGRIPNHTELQAFLMVDIGIVNAKTCIEEIEYLEEKLYNHEGDLEPTTPVLNGFIAITRYCRFLLFEFEEDGLELCTIINNKNTKKGLITQEIAETFLAIPKDFCCPISLDLMIDPVIVSTGQTYDRASISRWMEEGHYRCPKTGQMLFHAHHLVPNRALRNLIMQWCTAHGIPFDLAAESMNAAEAFAAPLSSKGAVEANSATALLVIEQLANGTETAKTIAAQELRMLAKTGKENRAFIAESGAIPHLQKLLSSSNPVAQEISVTAMLNLSIHETNKSRIMEQEGCLRLIIEVLRFGHTIEATENAAATLFSLSVVHDYKKRIADEEGAIEALAGLLKNGTPRGKKDAVTALFNVSTDRDNCVRMIESGAVKALVEAMGIEGGVAEESAGALALIVRQPIGAETVGKEEMAVARLIRMMRCGSPKGKENSVAVLLELCRSGGAATTQRVVKAPALAGLIQCLVFNGTKRARRKAASLVRVFQRCENASYGGNRDSSFTSDVSLLPIGISVPVL